MHQSNDNNISCSTASGEQSNGPDAEPPSTPAESDTAACATASNPDLGDQMIMTMNATVTNVEQPSGTETSTQNDIFKDEEGKEVSFDGAVASNNDQIRKEGRRTSHLSDVSEVGAFHVDEQAPQVNRRFYLGLNRPSVRARRERARQGRARTRRNQGSATDASGDNVEAQSTATNEPQWTSTGFLGRMNAVIDRVVTGGNPDGLISATLVEEGEVYEAEQVGYLERKWKLFAACTCVFTVLLAVLLPSLLYVFKNRHELLGVPISMEPSMQPSSPPSFTQGPTLEIVQTRGFVRCGLRLPKIKAGKGLEKDLCRAIAAVLFGKPENFETDNFETENFETKNIETVPVTSTTRFQQLTDRSTDLLLSSTTHTIEREVREKTTGVGFTFSSPYYYDGMAYYGNSTFVKCAEENKRYDECSLLRICVSRSSTHYDIVEYYFPPDFFTVGSSLDELTAMLVNGTCNVITQDRSTLLNIAKNIDGEFIIGNKSISKEPFGIVTRKDDREFSDLINWVVHALFYGEEQGLTKDLSLCQNYTNLTSHVSDLDFLNAVYCVGNYGEIYDETYRGKNRINDGTTGMIYAVPFGELHSEDSDGSRDSDISASVDDGLRNEKLNCGVVVPDNSTKNIENNTKLVGMSVAYCRTVAAALSNGDFNNVNLIEITEDSSFVALDNGTIDVLAGAKISLEYDFESPSLPGFHFSTPYYYGNETTRYDVSFFSLATREDDSLFSSFVNCIVLATIYADENSIKKKISAEMPSLSIFGSHFNWALRDAIAYSGSYDQVYKEHFSEVFNKERGRNMLNTIGGPQIHSFPGLR